MAAAAMPEVEEAVERVRVLQERVLNAVRQNGSFYLDAYEKNLSAVLALTERAAATTQLDWAKNLTTTYADFVKRVSYGLLRAGRNALG